MQAVVLNELLGEARNQILRRAVRAMGRLSTWLGDLCYLHGIVLHERGGKTAIVRAYKLKNRGMMVDLDELVLSSLEEDTRNRVRQLRLSGEIATLNQLTFPVAKRLVRQLRTDFPRRNIVIFSAQPDMLGYVGVFAVNIHAYVASDSFWESTLSAVRASMPVVTTAPAGGAGSAGGISAQQAELEIKAIKNSRTHVMMEAGKSAELFDSFQTLTTALRSRIGLVLSS